MPSRKLNGSLSGRAILYTVGQLSLTFLSVLSAPLFVRLMTTSEYGMASVYLTWVAILSNVVGLRVDASIQNAWAEYGENKLASYVSSVSSLALCFFIPVLIVTVLARDFLAGAMAMSSDVVLLCFVTAFAIAFSNVRLAYLNVRRDAAGNMVVSLLLSLAQIAFSVLFLLFCLDDGFLARIGGYSIPSVLFGIAFAICFWAKGRTFFKKEYWRFCLGLSLPLIFNGIAYMLINQSDRLMINALVGADAAGIYSFSYSCALPASVICGALNSAWTPDYYRMMKDGNTDLVKARARRYMDNMTLVTGAIMLVSPEVLEVLGTEDYLPGIKMLPLVVMAYYFQFLYTWPVNCEFYYKKTKMMTVATVVALAVNVGLNLWLIPLFGMLGAALASLVAFAFLFAFHDCAARGLTPNYMFSRRWYLRGIVPMLVVLVVTYFAIDLMAVRWVFALFVFIALLCRVVKARSIF